MSPEELQFFTEGQTDMTMEQSYLVPLTHDSNAVPDRAPRPQLHRYILKEGEVDGHTNYLYPIETNPETCRASSSAGIGDISLFQITG
jgi:hypothetical protein